MDTIKIQNIIAFSMLNGIGATFIKNNLYEIKRRLFSPIDLCSLNNKVSIADYEQNQKYAKKIIDNCENLNIQISTILDEDYPQLLLEIKDPPPVLYMKGNRNLLNKAVAIIGTRKSSELGNKIAMKVGTYFSKNWAVCNGLVDGIDKNSISNGNSIFSNVIGVMSGGLNVDSTVSKLSSNLAHKILENNGLLISEYEPNKIEDQFSGSKASRIQAGLSRALILIQSSLNGGSKYTLKAFSYLNRPLAVIEYQKSEEYQKSDIFAANRLIIDKKKEGIMTLCDIKKINSILISKIISLEKSEDYQIIEREIISSSSLNNKLNFQPL